MSFKGFMSTRISWRLLLGLAIIVAYLPFLNLRLLPTAGDDKVYVAQALEMREAGQFFLQRLFDQPNYFKGLLHYLLIQLGQGVFGLQLIAIRYMNLFFALIAGLSIGAVVLRHGSGPERTSLALWAGLSCAFSAGTLGHVFASQMEVQLLAFYCLAMMLLDRSDEPLSELAFWIVCGLAGWSKSPLHSALMGLSFWLYWGSLALVQNDPQFKSKLLSLRSWIFCLIGVLVCVAGYLPAILNDWIHFHKTYLERETFSKSGGNHGPAWQAWFPLFFYYLWPWNWLALLLFTTALPRMVRVKSFLDSLRSTASRPFFLAWAMILPILTFFWVHLYRGENYTYPAQGAVFLILALLWAKATRGWFMKATEWLTALQLLIPAGALVWLVLPSSPEWLPRYGAALLTLLSIGSAGVVVLSLRRPHSLRQGVSALGLTPFVVSMGLLLYWLGDYEMKGLRQFLATRKSDQPLCYVNLDKNIWNEWGTLAFTIGAPVKSCHNDALSVQHLLSGGTLIVSHPDTWQHLSRLPELQSLHIETHSWTRWGRHAHIPSGGRSRLLEARATGNWKLLEREFLLITGVPTKP